jgi:hypothetical protein
MTAAEVRARVAKGAALLDQERPGWVEQVNAELLFLGSCTRCILGQLLGHYFHYDRLGLTNDTARAHGFNISLQDDEDVFVGFDKLQVAWLEAIAERVTPAPVVAWQHREDVPV